MVREENVPLLPERQLLTPDLAHRTLKKLDRRLLSLLAGLGFIVYANRGSVGYVAQQLCDELNLTNEDYGKSVSLFHVGYILTLVLGNILLKQLGAPVWLSCIGLSGGIISAALGFIQTASQFHLLRALEGVAEGGTFPAVWYLISLFYPPEHVTNACGVISFALTLSSPISSPISAALLSLGDYVGIEGWRLVFIVEGLVPFLYSAVLYLFLPASPESAAFLDAEEKEWIAAEQEREDSIVSLSFWQEVKTVVTNRAWMIFAFWGLCDFGISSCLMFWATLLIHGMLYQDEEETDSKSCRPKNATAVVPILLTAIPFLVAGMSCLILRRYHVKNRSRLASALSCIAGVSLVLWAVTPSWLFVLRFFLLTCTMAAKAMAFVYVIGLVMTTSDPSARSAAASLLNATAALGAITFPSVFGKVIDAAGPEVAIAVSGGIYIFVSFLVAWT